MKRYIVTGGAGFIGSNLAHRLMRDGADVYIIDDLSTGFKRNIPDGAFFYKADISRPDKLARCHLPPKADAVFHLAGQPSGEASFDDPLRDMDVNYKGTYNILKLAQAKRCRRFIFASSMSVYGDVSGGFGMATEDRDCHPLSYYGCNKLASERLVALFASNAKMMPTIVRLFSVYGPGQNMLNMKQGIVSIYLSYLLNDEPIHIKGALVRFRDLVYIRDVIDALVLCAEKRSACGQIFNIGTGVKTTVRALTNALLRAYGKDDSERWVRCAGSTLGDSMGCVADIRKAKKILGWTPRYSLDEGLVEMKEWLDRTKELWVKRQRTA